MPDQVNQPAQNMDEMNLLDYWRVVCKRKGIVAALWCGSVLIAGGYSLWTPKLYRATATILPPVEIGIGQGNQLSLSMGGPATQRGGDLLDSLIGGGTLSLARSTPNRDTYIALLKSQRVRKNVMDNFENSWGPSVGSMISDVKVSPSKKSVISVTVDSQDPALSAAFANFYLQTLGTTLSDRAKATAKLQMEYYERQLDRTRHALKEAQEALIKFQEKNRYIALDPVTRGAIATGAMQAGSVMALEMERNLKRMYLTDQHPEMVVLNRRIYEAKKLLSHELYGEPQSLPPESPGSPPRREFFVPKAKMTPLQFKLAEVYRDLTFRQSIENSIHQNLESLKYTIDNPPAIYIDWLDRAVPPKQPFKPVISYNVAVAAIGSLVIGSFLALFLEYIERIRTMDRLRRTAETAGTETSAQ